MSCVNMIVLAISAMCWCVVHAALDAPRCPNVTLEHTCIVLKPWAPGGNVYYTYQVDGNELTVEVDASTFSMTCNRKTDLDNPALPRLDALTGFTIVKLRNCNSQNHSYSDALRKLNIKVLNELHISGVNGLSSNHLAGLDSLQTLEINDSILETNLFQSKSSPNVTRIRFINMNPPPFNSLPKSLKELQLVSSSTLQLQSDDFKVLSKEFKLIVRGNRGNATVKTSAPLKDLTLAAKFVFLNAELANTLENVDIINWADIRPLPWKNCKLSSLTVRGLYAEILPDNWLADCFNLSILKLIEAKSSLSLTNDTFKGARALREVTLVSCRLHELPTEFLNDADNLELLNLSGNFLHTLSSINIHLKTLNLANNNFTSKVFKTIASANDLEDLDLQNNILLGINICIEMLAGLNNLVRLNLRNTNVHRICIKWRQESPLLEDLNLSANKITYLRYEDLQFTGTTSVKVDLTNNNITHLEYDEDGYYNLAKNCQIEPDGTQPRGASRAVIQFSRTLQCGCKEAWTALAKRACPNHVRLENATCVGDAELSKVDFEKLACSAKQEYCPRKCHCKQVLRLESPTRVIHVMCEHANLTQLPKLPKNASVAWKLHLAYNNISSPSAKDLPLHVLELNLTHNGITQVDVVALLLPAVRRMYLSGNELDCACGAEQGLAILHANASVIADFDKLKCIGGASLVVTGICGRGIIVGLAVGLAPLLAAVITLIICLVRPASRTRLKLVLRGLGFLPHPLEPNDGKPFDVFLSFSHLDFERAVKRIQQWLETGNKPYKTLIHYRDWPPGAWIPTQIEASVRLSKRTVAVVSRDFLKSTWASAEFRQAYEVEMMSRDNQPRLVVILLDDLDQLALDDPANVLFRRHLTTNTYLCWGDAWFWTKLRAALPPPRGTAQPEPNGLWTTIRKTLCLSCRSAQDDTERATMELPPRTPQAETLAKEIAKWNWDKNLAVTELVDEVMDQLQPDG